MALVGQEATHLPVVRGDVSSVYYAAIIVNDENARLPRIDTDYVVRPSNVAESHAFYFTFFNALNPEHVAYSITAIFERIEVMNYLKRTLKCENDESVVEKADNLVKRRDQAIKYFMRLFPPQPGVLRAICNASPSALVSFAPYSYRTFEASEWACINDIVYRRPGYTRLLYDRAFWLKYPFFPVVFSHPFVEADLARADITEEVRLSHYQYFAFQYFVYFSIKMQIVKLLDLGLTFDVEEGTEMFPELERLNYQGPMVWKHAITSYVKNGFRNTVDYFASVWKGARGKYVFPNKCYFGFDGCGKHTMSGFMTEVIDEKTPQVLEDMFVVRQMLFEAVFTPLDRLQ